MMLEKKKVARFLVLAFYATIPYAFIKILLSQLNLPFILLIFIVGFDYYALRGFKLGFKIIYIIQIAVFLIILMSFINYIPGYEGGWSIIRQLAFFGVSFFSLLKLMKYGEVESLSVKKVFSNSVFALAIFGFLGFESNIRGGRLFLFGMNPNFVAFLAVIAFTFCFLVLVHKDRIEWGFITLIKLIAYFSLILMTGSRGAIISLAIVIFLILFLKEKVLSRRLNYLFFATLLLGGLYLAVINNSLLYQRFFESDDVRDAGRFELWQKVLTVYESDPLFGVGVFEYQSQIELLNNDRIINTHNEFLSFLVYSGVLGLFFFLVFLYKLFRIGRRTYRYSGNTEILVLFVLLLVNLFKSGGVLVSPILWAIFAYIIVYGYRPAREIFIKQ